jgi:hypothetical protein
VSGLVSCEVDLDGVLYGVAEEEPDCDGGVERVRYLQPSLLGAGVERLELWAVLTRNAKCVAIGLLNRTSS